MMPVNVALCIAARIQISIISVTPSFERDQSVGRHNRTETNNAHTAHTRTRRINLVETMRMTLMMISHRQFLFFFFSRISQQFFVICWWCWCTHQVKRRSHFRTVESGACTHSAQCTESVSTEQGRTGMSCQVKLNIWTEMDSFLW